MNVDAAAQYAERYGLHALVVQRGDEIVFERYGGGYDAAKPHALYSGTKSFWGLLASAAQDDGLLDLDEPVMGLRLESARDAARTAAAH